MEQELRRSAFTTFPGMVCYVMLCHVPGQREDEFDHRLHESRGVELLACSHRAHNIG